MAMMVKGARVPALQITLDTTTGLHVAKSGSYELMSSTDIVLAKQNWGEYSQDFKYDMSAETKKLLRAFMLGVTDDINSQLGLTEEVSK